VRKRLQDLEDAELRTRLIAAHCRCIGRRDKGEPVKGSYLARLKTEMFRRFGFDGGCGWWHGKIEPYIQPKNTP
jgi:hypothetical protein